MLQLAVSPFRSRQRLPHAYMASSTGRMLSPNSVAFQLPQLQREHFWRGGGHGPAQFGKTHGAGNELPENQRLVFAADHVEGGFHRAVKWFSLSPAFSGTTAGF